MESVAFYLRLVSAHVRSQMQYKVSFILSLVGSFMVNLTEFGVVAILFTRIPQLAGWSLAEVALLYGLSGTAFATAETVASALDSFQVHIVRGTFDRVLVRPRGALFQLLVEDVALRRLGRVLQAGLVLVVAVEWLAIDWSLDKVVVLGMALAGGTAIYFSIFVLGASFCFLTVA